MKRKKRGLGPKDEMVREDKRAGWGGALSGI
jgi:hypothetical protein